MSASAHGPGAPESAIAGVQAYSLATQGSGQDGRRAAVLGHPVAHSLSPVLHRAAYAALGLTGWTYEAVDVTEETLGPFVAALDGTWAGLSLTMPLKKTVIPLLNHVEPLAEVVGAVNTVLVQGAGPAGPVLVGANTDVHGIVAALGEALSAGAGDPAGPAAASGAARPVAVPARTGVVLGAGATAASALAALAQLGCTSPLVFVRSMTRAGATMRAAHRMGVEPRFLLAEPSERLHEACAHADLVVSTLPPRAGDPVATALTQSGRLLAGVLLDCAYDPRPTALAVAWRDLGGAVTMGERMLLHQATEQVRLMTGRPAPLAAMEDALSAALG